MSEKTFQKKQVLYLDACIYLDLLLGRSDGIRPLGEFAYSLLKKIEGGEFELLVSDHLIHEVKKNLEDNKQFDELMNSLFEKGRIKTITKTGSDVNRAKRMSERNWKDILHAILAKKGNADYLVTRNIKDFFEAGDLVQIKYPENF